MLVKALTRDRGMLQIGRQRRQPRRNLLPVVERGLQRRRDMCSIGIPGKIVGHDDQMTVTARFQ